MIKLGARLANRLPASESAMYSWDRSITNSTRLFHRTGIEAPAAEVSGNSAPFSSESMESEDQMPVDLN